MEQSSGGTDLSLTSVLNCFPNSQQSLQNSDKEDSQHRSVNEHSLQFHSLSSGDLLRGVKELLVSPTNIPSNSPGVLQTVPEERRNNAPVVIDCTPSAYTDKESSNNVPSKAIQKPVPRPRMSSVNRHLQESNSSVPLPVGLSNPVPAILSEFSTTITETPSSAAARTTQDSNFGTLNGMEPSTPPQPPPRPSLVQRLKNADDERMFKLRNYQVEISQNILQRFHDIIILPTGTGKTAVAVNAIQQHLMRLGKAAKVLFLAHRVVLAEQQLDVIKSHLPLEWSDKCTKLTGGDIDSMDDLEKMLTGPEWAVIVATPQTVFNYFLAFESSSMKRFSLIIFDEAHNAVGGHPYNRLLYQYMDERFLNSKTRLSFPQLVGLTASVGLGDAKNEFEAVDYILSFCSRLDLQQHPSEVIRYKEELEAIRNPPVEEHRKVEESRSDPLSMMIKREIMPEIISDVKQKLRTHRSLQKIHFNPPKDLTLQSFEQKCIQAENHLSVLHDTCQNDLARDCYISLKHLKVYHLALRWANLARLQDAMKYMNEELSKPELSGNKFAEKYQSVWQPALEEVADREEEYMNEKLVILREELDKALSPDNCRDGEQARVMVFVEYRWLASVISEWLKSISSQYKAERFVSRLASKGDYGMATEEARTIMTKFRNGELNILVATSVLSEGVDIPECNGTIRYMYMKDVIAEVQVPGRMRAWGGRVVAIVNDKLFRAYQENKSKERLMARALEQVRRIPLEEFLKKMEAQQERDYRARLADKKKKNALGSGGGGDKRNAPINCKQCGRRLGQLTDVHRYLEAHYIILSKDVLDNVDVTEGVDYYGVPLDGMTDIGILVCKDENCHAEIGRLINIKISNQTRKLGIWDINKIRLAGSTGNFAKWEDVAKGYGIEDIKQEKLRAKIDSGHSLELEMS